MEVVRELSTVARGRVGSPSKQLTWRNQAAVEVNKRYTKVIERVVNGLKEGKESKTDDGVGCVKVKCSHMRTK